MQNLIDSLQKLKELTDVDLENRSIFSLLASATEELGELSRELKIEEGEFGNTYKESDEGSRLESVDLTICALSIYFARGGSIESLAEDMNGKLAKWERVQNV